MEMKIGSERLMSSADPLIKYLGELTQYNDKNICNCQWYEVVVHGTVKPFALDYHENHGKVAKETTDEHNDVEDGK